MKGLVELKVWLLIAALKNNPQLLELSAIEKWDGKLPVYSGSSVPFVNLEKATKQQ